MKINKQLILALFSVLWVQMSTAQLCGSSSCSGLLSQCCTNLFTGQSQCFNPQTHQCCSNRILCAVNDSCCGNVCFNPSQYFCCESSQSICQAGSTTCCPSAATTGGATTGGATTGGTTTGGTTGTTTGGGGGTTPGVNTREYVLMVTDGYIELPVTGESSNDLNSTICLGNNVQRVYVWGYVGGLWKINNITIDRNLDYTNSSNFNYLMGLQGTATIPSPIISGAVGERIYVHVINLGFSVSAVPTVPHTFTIANANLPYQLDGFLETSVGIPAWNNTSVEPPVITYFWNPEKPGTYPYYCPVGFGVHIQMGMYGAAVVYPASSAVSSLSDTRNWKYAYASDLARFDEEWVFILSEIDLGFHSTVESGSLPDFSSYRPTYFLLNGRVFPQTLLANATNNTVAAVPNSVSGLSSNVLQLQRLTYNTYINISRSQQALIRLINVGINTAAWRSVGGTMRLLGRNSVIDVGLNLAKALGDESLLTTTNLVDIPSSGSVDVLLQGLNLSTVYSDFIFNGLDGHSPMCSQVSTIAGLDPSLVSTIPLQTSCSSESGPILNSTSLLDSCNSASTGTTSVSSLYPQFGKLFNAWWPATNNGGSSQGAGGQTTYFQINA